jgi:hypothetical protein
MATAFGETLQGKVTAVEVTLAARSRCCGPK